MNKFSNPIRYTPDHYISISHEHSFMREVKGQGYVDGKLYDELYAEYAKLKSTKTLKQRLVSFLRCFYDK
ncbi:hypothetical protein PT273_09080 [Orbaceae bacterium ESL0727]|nr:hypothetical protein [Orbaceae bacterium ESL0727]MDF7667992.1 hypothetical protein [Orbaceae bacterium ESL0727]